MIKNTTITTFPVSDLPLFLTHEKNFNPSENEKTFLTYGTINSSKLFNLNHEESYLKNMKVFQTWCDAKNIEFLFTYPSEIMPKNEQGDPQHLFWAKGLDENKKRVNYYFTFDLKEKTFLIQSKDSLLKSQYNKLFVDNQIEDSSFHDYIFTYQTLDSKKQSLKTYYGDTLLSLIEKISEPIFMVKDSQQEVKIKLIPSYLGKRESFNQQHDFLVFNPQNESTQFTNPFDFFENLNVNTESEAKFGCDFYKITYDYGYESKINPSNLQKRLPFSSLITTKETRYTGEYIDYEQVVDYDNNYKKGNIYSYEEMKSIYQYKDMLSRKLYNSITQFEQNVESYKKILKIYLKSPYFDINYHAKANSDIAHFIFNNDLDELMIDFVENDYDIDKNKSLKKQINELHPENNIKKFAIYEKIKLLKSKDTYLAKNHKIKL